MELIAKYPSVVFYFLLIIAALLAHIPIAGKYFRSVNTLLHEAGHAFATLILSGEVIAVNIFSDSSGTTVTKSKSKTAQAVIALAGYAFSSLCAWLLLFMYSKGYHLLILFILSSIALILMILSIKNTYGLFWSGTFILLNLLIIYFNNGLAIKYISVFYALIVLSDSVISAVIVFILSLKQPKKAGDATNLQKITGIPVWFWGLVFLGFSGFIAWIIITSYFPPLKFTW
jgi:hypothetical protein